MLLYHPLLHIKPFITKAPSIEFFRFKAMRIRKAVIRMSINKTTTQFDVRQEEEAILHSFNDEFDQRILDCSSRIQNSRDIIHSEHFHEEERGNVFAIENNTIASLTEEISELNELKKDTYFARVDLVESIGVVSCYLSECDGTYSSNISIEGHKALILGFGSATSKVSQIFERFYMKSSEPVDGSEIILRRQTLVKNGILTEVDQHYPPLLTTTPNGLSDEYLIRILETNRNQPGIESIIKSIQAKQFQIISSDIRNDLIVQGCAGSGKTQILLLRLFFHKERIAQLGRDSLLLITPSKLFDGHISTLMRRYKILAEQQTIAEYYWSLLKQYDSRFKNRQYEIEYLEESLPDNYLQTVYSTTFLKDILTSIDECIHRHTETASKLLNLIPNRFENTPNIEAVQQLGELLENELLRRKNLLQLLKNNPDFSELKKEKADLERRKMRLNNSKLKAESALQRFQETYQSKQDKLCVLQESLEKLKSPQKETLAEEIATYMQHLPQATLSAWPDQISILGLAALHYRNQDKTRLYDLEKTTRTITEELSDAFGFTSSPEKFFASLNRHELTLKNNIENAIAETQTIESELYTVVELLNLLLSEMDITQQDIDEDTIRIMEQEAHFMRRFEVAVFEEAIWKKMLPIKNEYGVSIYKDSLSESDNDSKKRVLYKLDLAFYLQVYHRLYPHSKISQKRMICIDEGQSLSEFEFTLLREIHPKATFNVYGDLRQQLTPGSGIKDWSNLGMNQYYELNENYRNAVDIVDHCNAHFKTNMRAFGEKQQRVTRITPESIPKTLETLAQNQTPVAIIVRSQGTYTNMCQKLPELQLKTVLYNPDNPSEQKGKTPVYTIGMTRGLEFPCALVIMDEMNVNQRYLACTRATKELFYCAEEG